MKRRMLIHVFFLSITRYLGDALYMVRGLLLARLLGPGMFGLWASMRITQTFSHFATLGSRRGLLQLAPLADGAGEYQTAENLRRVASGLSLLTGFIITILALMMAALQNDPVRRNAWALFAATLLIIHLYQFQHANLRSKHKFFRIAIGDLVVAIITTTLGLVAAMRYGLIGFLTTLIIGQIIACAVMCFKGPAYPRPLLRRDEAIELIRIGFPVMASSTLCVLLWNTDKLLLWMMSGTSALGEYAVQASFTNVALLTPTVIATVLHPHLMRELGQHKTAKSIRPYLRRGGELVSIWSAPVIAIGFLVLHLPIRWWLTKYEAAIDPGRILMLATYFSMAATVPSTVLISLNGQTRLCAIRIVAIALAAIGGATALYHDQGYAMLALALALGLFVDGLATIYTASRRAELDLQHTFSDLFNMLLPFGILAASLWVACLIVPAATDTWQDDVFTTTIRVLMTLAGCLPWAAWRTHRLDLLKRN